MPANSRDAAYRRDVAVIDRAIHRLYEIDTYQLAKGDGLVAQDALGRLADLVERARDFANVVLECDSYGCENGPDKCLHADARRFLDSIGVYE